MKLDPKIKAAAHRAARTAAQAFVGVILAQWTASTPTISALIAVLETGSDLAGGSAIFAAACALGLNWARPVTPETTK